MQIYTRSKDHCYRMRTVSWKSERLKRIQASQQTSKLKMSSQFPAVAKRAIITPECINQGVINWSRQVILLLQMASVSSVLEYCIHSGVHGLKMMKKWKRYRHIFYVLSIMLGSSACPLFPKFLKVCQTNNCLGWLSRELNYDLLRSVPALRFYVLSFYEPHKLFEGWRKMIYRETLRELNLFILSRPGSDNYRLQVPAQEENIEN